MSIPIEFIHALAAADIDFCYSHDLDYMVSCEDIHHVPTIFIVFPGTKDIADLKTIKDGTYHLEVQRLWKSGLKAEIQQMVNAHGPCKFVIGGHSLGGVLAEIVGNRLADPKYAMIYQPISIDIVTFGAPKHRYKKFANAVRYMLKGDLIPYMPFRFEFAETPYTMLSKKHALVKHPSVFDLISSLLHRCFAKAHSIESYLKALTGVKYGGKED